MFHLLEAIVPVDEIICSRTQSHLVLEKSSLGLRNGLRTIRSVLGKTAQAQSNLDKLKLLEVKEQYLAHDIE